LKLQHAEFRSSKISENVTHFLFKVRQPYFDRLVIMLNSFTIYVYNTVLHTSK